VEDLDVRAHLDQPHVAINEVLIRPTDQER
jgi:hypothetical protein